MSFQYSYKMPTFIRLLPARIQLYSWLFIGLPQLMIFCRFTKWTTQAFNCLQSWDRVISITKPITMNSGALNATMLTANSFFANPTVTAGATANTESVTATSGGGTVTTNTYQITAAGPASQTLSYDGSGGNGNGNLANDGTNLYSWDAENRLVQITYPGSGNSTQFVYDGLGNRVKIVENGTVPAYTGNATKQFIFADGQMCEERDGSGVLVSQFYGGGQKTNGSAYFYTKDHLGSIRGVTDSSGTLKTSYSYDAYGRVSPNYVSGTVTSDMQFCGYYEHSRSLLNLTATRAYNANLGRFISRDPIEEDGGINLYAYVGNNPISYVDPLGLWRLSIQWRSPAGVDPALGAHGNLMLEPTGNESFPVQGWGASRQGLEMQVVPKGVLENPKYRQTVADSNTSKMSYCEVKAKMDAAAAAVGSQVPDWSFYRPFDIGPIPAQNSDTVLWEMINRMGLTPPPPMEGVWAPGYGPKPSDPEISIPVPRFQVPDFSIPRQLY